MAPLFLALLVPLVLALRPANELEGPLHKAALNGKVDLVAMLVEDDHDINGMLGH